MAGENNFERARKHSLYLTVAGSKASEGFVNGWNDALTISLSISAPPVKAGAWYPKLYRDGWESCRALLEAVHRGQGNVGEVQRVVEETELAFARLSG